ncbi:calcium homeostasis modulator protein 2-like [Microcaecilia unicolor]|uniref:Calcium homeostasis modulator protein 2-like n=1 Tax=Microcaecilia unicolor TaxID=1415580 RepID=A0A6P7Y6Z7_9AMPH|nr:calcium homeostasis modulator protein 2-like [Microcaecilia unicolor]
MSMLITEHMKFMYIVFKSQNVVIFNCLVVLGTLGSQRLYSFTAFQCPCAPKRNYRYGLAAIGIPALVLFLVGILMSNHTWNFVAECRRRGARNCTPPAIFLLLGCIVGPAIVAPITWSVISLLQGEAYVCALSEFVQSSSLKGFPHQYGPDILAKFPCETIPVEDVSLKGDVIRKLRYESQLIGWLLLGTVAITVFILKCLKQCCSTLGYRQEEYWSQYRSNESQLFKRTAEVHAKILAAGNIKQFFGFVALDKDEKQLLQEFSAENIQTTVHWNDITGMHIFRENEGFPIYSRLHKWAMRKSLSDSETESKETAVLPV